MNVSVRQRPPIPMAQSVKAARKPPTAKTRAAVHNEEHRRHFAWVDWLLARTGKTDASLAKDAGLAANYLYRKRTDGTVLGATQIRILSEHYDLPGPDTYQVPGAAGLSDEGSTFDSSDTKDAVTQAMVELALKSRPNAESWVLKTHALEDAGYLAGDIVVSDSTVHPMAGDAVVARVYDPRSGSAETVFRIFEPPYLVAASSEAGLRKPLLVDNERVIVVGPITQSLRSRRS